MTKPIVHFIDPAEFHACYDNILERELILANVYTLDHPRLGARNVRTSIVININEDGSFETLNTYYVPVQYKNESVN